ncbi:MAG: SAM-dependent methyltransferase [Microthrixaceae bacterium]|nr:SAM-dependent methyltransferase [Microthrixaceae bacterium]
MTVHILGVGPGDTDLLTLKAARILGAADAVVHDRLIGREILDFVPPSAERYDVGKAPRRPGPSQDEINRLLVALGKRLDTVVRVKGVTPSCSGGAPRRPGPAMPQAWPPRSCPGSARRWLLRAPRASR